MARIPTTCSQCDHTVNVAAEHAGKRMRCPGCAQVIQIPDPEADFELEDLIDVEDDVEEPSYPGTTGAGAPRRQPASTRRSPSRPRRRTAAGGVTRPGWQRLLIRMGLPLGVIVVCLILSALGIGNSESFFEAAKEDIRKAHGESDRAELMIAVARTQHRGALGEARSRAPADYRGRRRTQKSDYLGIIRGKVRQQLALLVDETSPSEEDFTSGYWQLVGLEQKTAVRFLEGGRYEQVFALVHERFDAGVTEGGAWNFSGSTLTWKPDLTGKLDPNPILLYSDHGMVLKEMAGHATFWRHHSGRGPFRK